MKSIYKPIVFYAILFTILGATLAMAFSLMLPNKDFSPNTTINNDSKTNFKVAKAFSLQIKAKPKKIVEQKRTSKEFLLTEFAINSIFLSTGEDMVIASDPKGGIFLSINDIHKNYKLVEIYQQKAKFQKGINYYWAFLNPDAEKAFKENTQHSSAVKTGESSNIRTTTSKRMFEEIIFKNGKYYIPQDLLIEYSDPSKFVSTIGARIYNINGAISFKVTHIKSSSIFRKLGINRGDMIVAMNNKPFKSASEPIKLFQNLKNLKQLKITVQNHGKTKELKYEVY